jgi:hypothetical protein
MQSVTKFTQCQGVLGSTAENCMPPCTSTSWCNTFLPPSYFNSCISPRSRACFDIVRFFVTLSAWRDCNDSSGCISRPCSTRSLEDSQLLDWIAETGKSVLHSVSGRALPNITFNIRAGANFFNQEVNNVSCH